MLLDGSVVPPHWTFTNTSNETAGEAAKRKQAMKVWKTKPRACFNCRTTETPRWRTGPFGPVTLCNYCGQKWGQWVRGNMQGACPIPHCWPLRKGMVLPRGELSGRRGGREGRERMVAATLRLGMEATKYLHCTAEFPPDLPPGVVVPPGWISSFIITPP